MYWYSLWRDRFAKSWDGYKYKNLRIQLRLTYTCVLLMDAFNGFSLIQWKK